MRASVAFLVLFLSTPVCAQTMGSTSGASSSINIANPASTTSTNRLITPPTVVAPGLAAAGIETCLGSSSGGISLMGGGLTFGSTKVDEGCTMRLLARQLYAFGFQKAAVALMCQDDHVAVAMAVAGTACPDRGASVETRRRSQVTSFVENPSSAIPGIPETDMAEGHVLDLTAKPITPEEEMLFARTSH